MAAPNGIAEIVELWSFCRHLIFDQFNDLHIFIRLEYTEIDSGFQLGQVHCNFIFARF